MISAKETFQNFARKATLPAVVAAAFLTVAIPAQAQHAPKQHKIDVAKERLKAEKAKLKAEEASHLQPVPRLFIQWPHRAKTPKPH